MVLILYIAVVVVTLYLCGSYLIEDARGSNASATIVEVQPSDRYEIRYVTGEGIECTVSLRWSSLSKPALEVGDTIVIHHPKNGPCSNVRHADDYGQPIISVIVLTMLATGFVLYVYFYRPTKEEQADA